jgi:hypothetical protein
MEPLVRAAGEREFLPVNILFRFLVACADVVAGFISFQPPCYLQQIV